MTNIRDLKLNIIDVLMQTDDLQTLTNIYQTLIKPTKKKEEVIKPLLQKVAKEIPTTEIRSGVSLEQIIAEQETTPITYAEISVMVEETEWDVSLEEMLAILD